MVDRIEFSKYLLGLSILFEEQLTKERVQIYWGVLKDEFVDLDEFKETMNRLLKTWPYRYFPLPSHILQSKVDKTEIDVIAHKAWNRVMDAIMYGSANSNPIFEDPVIISTINSMGGWKEVYNRAAYSYTNEDYERRQKCKDEFVYLYKRLAKKPEMLELKLNGVGNGLTFKVEKTYKLPVKTDTVKKLIKQNELNEQAKKLIEKISSKKEAK